jgi:2-polyprenyl-3-methyl-5-hydroxy-6-metoxy-1,4-benzoquinol methylase
MTKPKIKKCYLCRAKEFESVEGKVRDLPDMPIMRCKGCGLVFLADFGHIDERFYEQSKMREKEPISNWKRYLNECATDDTRRAAWIRPMVFGRTLLDFGCGAGGFLAKVKRWTRKCAGVEKDRRLGTIIKKRFKIKVYSDIEEVDEKFDIITLFHVLEHFKDPKDILEKLSRLLNKGGKVVIEVPNSNDALLSLYRNREFSEFTYWGCHLYLFNESNLKKLLMEAGLSVNFVRQIQRYPLSNHLYWLSHGKPGGHKIWNFLDSKGLNDLYEGRLAALKACDTLIASVKVKHS